MSGAQPKAANIAGIVSIVAEINPAAANKRHEQGWVDKISYDLNEVTKLALEASKQKPFPLHTLEILLIYGNISIMKMFLFT